MGCRRPRSSSPFRINYTLVQLAARNPLRLARRLLMSTACEQIHARLKCSTGDDKRKRLGRLARPSCSCTKIVRIAEMQSPATSRRRRRCRRRRRRRCRRTAASCSVFGQVQETKSRTLCVRRGRRCAFISSSSRALSRGHYVAQTPCAVCGLFVANTPKNSRVKRINVWQHHQHSRRVVRCRFLC